MSQQFEPTRVQELIYELKIEQVMVRDVITVSPECTMGELKELLRVRRIAGVPVVVGDQQLAGVISIENVIKALEEGEIDALVGEKMTRQAQTVCAEDSVISAVNLFARFGYGRFPVVDRQGRLVGILTKGDIVRGLLQQMEVRWRIEEIQQYRASHIFEDIESDQTGLVLRYNVRAHDFAHGGEASSKIKRALERLGGPTALVRRVSIATYEAETNIIIHSVGGEIIAEIHPTGVQILAIDKGPGIANVEQVLQPGYSTAPDWIRELGFGAGMGLSNIRACADSMQLQSELGVGSRLQFTFRMEERHR